MGSPNTVNPLLNGGSPYYIINRSLRFRASATAYLNRTFAAGNQQKWTWSGWVKRGALGVINYFLEGYPATAGNTNDRSQFYFTANDTLEYSTITLGVVTEQLTTTQVFRDPSAWYHIVIALDTTQATAANRLKFYVNGAQITVFSTATYPALNASPYINSAKVHYIGAAYNGSFIASTYLDGYQAEYNFIDGQQLTPSLFGIYDNNGVWQPIDYNGTYGTNGFYLPFNNTTSTTTLVADASGNGNNWTPNNISLTAGVTYDSMIDSPTVSNTASNYCTLNPISYLTTGTISNGNLTFTSGVADAICIGTFAVSSGKWYWEVTVTTVGAGAGAGIGIIGQPPSSLTVDITVAANGYGYRDNGQKGNNGSSVTYGASFTNGDIIGVALDMDAKTITFYKNNVSQGVAYSSLSGTFSPAMGDLSGTGSGTVLNPNFGQRPFTYTPPSGFIALNTDNLPNSVVSNGARYMAATTYTGTGASNTISNSANNTIGTTFQPDLVWIKSRSAATDHKLTDVIRGTTKAIISDTTGAETTDSTGLTAFLSTGFTVGADTNYNNNTATYVAWQWNAGSGSTSSNTSGSITSTTSVNATAGFSIVTYTGTGSNATVGHGLGVAPSLVIVKRRDAASAWPVRHTSITPANTLYLNTTALSAAATTVWNSTAPTSTVFSIGTSTDVNASTGTYVAYCWSAVDGYSAFGSYIGNGLADGTFIYLGFRPRFMLIKASSTTESWILLDTSRDTYNIATRDLYPNLANAETLTTVGDIVSNGFKMRQSATGGNQSNRTYIYAAFAENPFAFARAR